MRVCGGAAAICTIFSQPDAERVHEQFDVITSMLGPPTAQGRTDDAQRLLLSDTTTDNHQNVAKPELMTA